MDLPAAVAQTQCSLPTLAIFVYQVSSRDLLLESSQIILVLFQLFFVWNMLSLQALEICSLDLYRSCSLFLACFSF